MGMGGRIGGQGVYGQPQYGGGYPAGPGKGRAPFGQPPAEQSSAITNPPAEQLQAVDNQSDPYSANSWDSVYQNMAVTQTAPGKGRRPPPYYGGGFGGGFGGYQPSPYMPPSPYGGSFGGVFNQGYGVPRGIGSLLSNYPSYMPPRMPYNPYMR